MTFGGRLTLVPGQPEMSSDQIGKTVLWYSPDCGGTIRVKGADVSFLSGPTDQNGWSMDISTVPVGKYHVYGTETGLALSGAWTDPTSFLTRLDGIQVDPATQASWLGSINIGMPGQLTAHFGYGQARRFDVYNAYNRRPIVLRVVTQPGIQYCPTNQYPAFQPFNNDANNKAAVFTGKAEAVDVEYSQSMFINTVAGPYGIIAAVGWNGAVKGYWEKLSSDATSMASSLSATASYAEPAAVGENTATMFIAGVVNSSNVQSAIWGSAAGAYPNNPDLNSVLVARWNG